MSGERLLIAGARAVLPGGVAPSDILIEDGEVLAVGRGLPTDGGRVLDAAGLLAGPGFVDVHVHGGGGHSFFRPDPENVRAYAAWAPRHGVTSFLISTVGSDAVETMNLLEALRPAVGAPGAEPLGFHLEGPFLNPLRKGAFPAVYLRQPSVDEWRAYQEAAGGMIRQITVAPELPGALDLIRAIVDSGVTAAMGHTDATVAEARAGFDVGITHVTHLFNAMRPIHQREGGPAVAALLNGGVTCELICDGAHVSEEVLQLALGVLGPDRAVVVTDNLEIAGVDSVTAEFGGAAVQVRGEAAVRDDGTIVGSVAPFAAHFRRARRLFGGDLGAAFRACSTNPARVAGVGGRKGALLPGADADIVLIDADGGVMTTICRGEVAFDGRNPDSARGS